MLAVEEIYSSRSLPRRPQSATRAPVYERLGRAARRVILKSTEDGSDVNASADGQDDESLGVSSSLLHFEPNVAGSCAMCLAWTCEAFALQRSACSGDLASLLLDYRSVLVSAANKTTGAAIPAASAYHRSGAVDAVTASQFRCTSKSVEW